MSLPVIGQSTEVLLALYSFQARSQDELNLQKGDRVVVVERDDQYSDGWYQGVNLSTGKAGIFPAVYTTANIIGNSIQTNKILYNPLDFLGFEFRLLTLLEPGSDPGKELSCQLRIATLIEPPSYIALSYCWGDLGSTVGIKLNGTTIQVTRNLEPALRSLRSHGHTTVWVDALCINQNDTLERGLQVTRMGLIYSRAAKVVAWLGEGTDEQRSAMTHLADLDRGPQKFIHMESILHFEYWKRVWIIQELSKARSVQLMLGDCTLPWDIMEGLAMRDQPSEERKIIGTLCRFRANEQKKERSKLFDAIWDTRYTLSTDPRDKIFALLGLTSNGAELVPTPNYLQGFAVICQNVFVALGEELPLPLLLLLSNGSSTLSTAPTWVPDWSNLNPSPWLGSFKERLDKIAALYEAQRQIGATPLLGKISDSCLQVLACAQYIVTSAVPVYTQSASQLTQETACKEISTANLTMKIGAESCLQFLQATWDLLCRQHWPSLSDRPDGACDASLGPAVLTAILGTKPPTSPEWATWRNAELYPESDFLKPLRYPALISVIHEFQDSKQYAQVFEQESLDWRHKKHNKKLNAIEANQRMLVETLKLASRHRLRLCSIESQTKLEHPMCLSPDNTKAGDKLVQLVGCDALVVLRTYNDGFFYIGDTNSRCNLTWSGATIKIY